MTDRRSSARRIILVAATAVLGLAALVGCQLRQFRPPHHEPAIPPLSAR